MPLLLSDMAATLAQRRAFLLALFGSRIGPWQSNYVQEKIMFALAPMTSELALRASLDHDNRERYDELIQQAVS